MKIISRKEAKALGLKRYYTGKPCINGHDSERMTASGVCRRCRKERLKIWKTPSRRSDEYFKNKKRYNKSNKKWRLANPQVVLVIVRNRKARKRNAEGRHYPKDINQLFLDQGGLCLCGVTLFQFHVDHKTPLIRGGSNWPSNLQLLCVSCNLGKGAKTYEEWYCGVAS